LARWIDSGRRIGRSVAQLRCTKLPGVARLAQRGAARRITNWSAPQSVWASRTASSSAIVPRWLRSAPLAALAGVAVT